MTASTYLDDQTGESACFLDEEQAEECREWIAAHAGAIHTGSGPIPEWMASRVREQRELFAKSRMESADGSLNS